MGNEEKTEDQKEAEALKKQVDQYYTLSIIHSARGQVVLLFIGIIILSLFFAFFELVPLEDVLLTTILYIPILFFVYKGHKWAMILLAIVWALEKVISGYVILDSGKGGIVSSIIWLVIGLMFIIRALKVEDAKNKIEVVNNETPLESNLYCKNCGTKFEIDGKFCTQCGSSK